MGKQGDVVTVAGGEAWVQLARGEADGLENSLTWWKMTSVEGGVQVVLADLFVSEEWRITVMGNRRKWHRAELRPYVPGASGQIALQGIRERMSERALVAKLLRELVAGEWWATAALEAERELRRYGLDGEETSAILWAGVMDAGPLEFPMQGAARRLVRTLDSIRADRVREQLEAERLAQVRAQLEAEGSADPEAEELEPCIDCGGLNTETGTCADCQARDTEAELERLRRENERLAQDLQAAQIREDALRMDLDRSRERVAELTRRAAYLERSRDRMDQKVEELQAGLAARQAEQAIG